MTAERPSGSAHIVLVTGASGAGRATTINALEDVGFEAIDNMPLSLIERLLSGPRLQSLALGVDVRNRDFTVDGVLDLIERMSDDPDIDAELFFLDCRADVLLRRYSETRRRHPLAPAESPDVGIAREVELLLPVREKADRLIDTSEMTPHDLKAEVTRLFGTDVVPRLAVSVESFSYKRGLPRGVDMVFDVRFLANPHWEPELRALDGRNARVASFVQADPRFPDFFDRLTGLVMSLLPAFVDEGKTYLSIALGCTGGQHRSVALAENLANVLEGQGWRVSTRHRELERRGRATAPLNRGTGG